MCPFCCQLVLPSVAHNIHVLHLVLVYLGCCSGTELWRLCSMQFIVVLMLRGNGACCFNTSNTYWLVHSHSSAETPCGVVSMLMGRQSRTVCLLSGLSPLGGDCWQQRGMGKKAPTVVFFMAFLLMRLHPGTSPNQ